MHALREWSHRANPEDLEADFYVIEDGLIARVEDLAAQGELDLDHSFYIESPDGRELCTSLDDFSAVWLGEDIQTKVKPP